MTEREIVDYLLKRRLISALSIVEGDLVVEDVSQRNRNVKIIREHGPCYLLKQASSPEGAATIAHEAAVYELLRSNAGRGGVGRFLPRLYEYDPHEHLLILELIDQAEDLQAYHARGRFSSAVAASVGAALGALHQLPKAEAQRCAQARPWALSAHYLDLDTLQRISSANLQLVQIVQRSPDLRQGLDELRQGWRAAAFIHNDFKWDNCLLARRGAGRRAARLKIVDWEFAGVGDPCWDVGTVFGGYLSFWILSIPITGDAPPERYMDLARYPLERMHPALRSFWQAYTHQIGLGGAEAERRLLSAVKYAAARLVQTAFEQTQAARDLTGNLVCLLQLGLNMLRRPHEAIAHLLGIAQGS